MATKAHAISACEKRNRALFAERFPGVTARIARIAEYRSRIVRDGRRHAINIDLGGVELHPAPAAQWDESQLRAFRADPDRLALDDPSYCNLTPISLKMLDDLTRRVQEPDIQPHMTGRPVADVGYLFVLGIGLAGHLEALLSETPARHVVLIEPFAEFLGHALGVVDWSALVALADRRRITLHFVLADDPASISYEIENLIAVSGNTFLDGTYFYQHYPCWIFREAIVLLRDKLKTHYITSGFFEDEIEMLRNSHRLLQTCGVYLVEPKVRREQTHPLFIVGAGPSLDRDLSHLRALRDRAIVVSCGTSIGILLKNGIRPDLHCEIERGETVHMLLAGIREEYGFEGISLIASTTVDPRIPPLFDKTWCYVRAGLSPARVLTPGVPPLTFADPLCCNAAFAAMTALGFRNIWLFGLDLATRDVARHHAADSLYYKPENAELEKAYLQKWDRVVPGNFGGEVRTFWAFDFGRYMLGLSQRQVRANLINCSDGARIDGAIPKMAAAVTLPASGDRRVALARGESTMRFAEAGELLAETDLQSHIDGCDAYLAMLDDVLADWLACEESFFDLEERLVTAIRAQPDRIAGFHRMARGSVAGMLRLGAFFASRIDHAETRHAFRAHFAATWRRLCGEMADDARAFLRSLDGGQRTGGINGDAVDASPTGEAA